MALGKCRALTQHKSIPIGFESIQCRHSATVVPDGIPLCASHETLLLAGQRLFVLGRVPIRKGDPILIIEKVSQGD